MDSTVSLVQCADYDEDTVEAAVRRSLELIGGLAGIINKGDKVLLKPNLLAPADPDDAVTTHPAVVRAMIKLIREAGGNPFVADSPGYIRGDVKDGALIRSGIKAAAESMGAKALLFESIENPYIQIDVPGGLWFRTIYAARLVLEADVIISLPKLKTHGNTLYTGAVKNMFAAAAPGTRLKAHNLAEYEKFSGGIVDIYSTVRPDLAVMDAVVGMEGMGPRHGDPKHVNAILASRDPVALDSVMSRIIGFDPMEIYTTVLAGERGLGTADPDRIQVVGEKLEDMLVDFKKPGRRMLNIPSFLIRLLMGLVKVQPWPVDHKCIQCGNCVKNCPADAMKLDPFPVIDRKLCILCYCCNEMCPENAVEVRRSWLAERLMK